MTLVTPTGRKIADLIDTMINQAVGIACGHGSMVEQRKIEYRQAKDRLAQVLNNDNDNA